jgi:hypothetical protein
VRDGGDALGALGQQHAAASYVLVPLSDPALLAEHPDVQVRDVLTGRLDQVLHGLDHPGANPGRAGS